jgi:hypothetical protein
MGQDERALRWRALRALAFALILFAYAIVQRPLQNSEILLFNLNGEGLDIIIWVAFWFPLDALVFGVLSYQMDSESYRRASEMQLSIKPAYLESRHPFKKEMTQPPVNPSGEGDQP